MQSSDDLELGDLSPREIKKIKDPDKLYSMCNNLKNSLEKEASHVVYRLGLLFARAKEERLYRKHYKTFRRFCESLGYSVRYGHLLTRLTKEYTETEFKSYTMRRLAIISRHFPSKEVGFAFLEAHADLSITELEDEVRAHVLGDLRGLDQESAVQTLTFSDATQLSPTPPFVPWADFTTRTKYGTLQLQSGILQLAIDGGIAYGRFVPRRKSRKAS